MALRSKKTRRKRKDSLEIAIKEVYGAMRKKRAPVTEPPAALAKEVEEKPFVEEKQKKAPSPDLGEDELFLGIKKPPFIDLPLIEDDLDAGIISGDLREKDRIRGPRLKVLIKRSRGIGLEETMIITEMGSRVIASNKRISRMLENRGGSEFYKALPCRTGTLVVYTAPGKELGKQIVCTDPKTNQKYIFHVPEEHQHKKDVALVVEHPDYFLQKDENEFVVFVKNPENIHVIENFPSSNGCYLGDPEHDIPFGDEVSPDVPGARYLFRKMDDVVSQVFRGLVFHDRRGILMCGMYPSSDLGVLVEAPEE